MPYEWPRLAALRFRASNSSHQASVFAIPTLCRDAPQMSIRIPVRTKGFVRRKPTDTGAGHNAPTGRWAPHEPTLRRPSSSSGRFLPYASPSSTFNSRYRINFQRICVSSCPARCYIISGFRHSQDRIPSASISLSGR